MSLFYLFFNSDHEGPTGQSTDFVQWIPDMYPQSVTTTSGIVFSKEGFEYAS